MNLGSPLYRNHNILPHNDFPRVPRSGATLDVSLTVNAPMNAGCSKRIGAAAMSRVRADCVW
jgi:hypothetical protein